MSDTTEAHDPSVRFQVIMAAFSDEDAADLALDELQMTSADHGGAIQDAAVVRRGADGVLHTNETNTWDTGAAVAAGSMIGGLIGLLGGPPGLAAGAASGAVVGDVVVRVHSARTLAMTSDVLKQLADVLCPDSSALVAVISNQPVDGVRELVQKAGVSNLRWMVWIAGMADALAHRKSAVYAIACTPDELDETRLAALRAGARYTGLRITDQGIFVEDGQVTDGSHEI